MAKAVSACSNTEEEASKALRELGGQYEAASLWDFRAPRPGLMDENEVEVALNAVTEIRANLDTIVAKFPETTAVKDLLSKDPYSDGLSIQKIDAQIKYLLESEKVLFQHRSRSFQRGRINRLVVLLGLVLLKKATPHAKKNRSICIA